MSPINGPTEITILSHISTLSVGDNITIGPPIPNTTCYILDAEMRMVPIGVDGEMYLGGIGVSSGYVNLPEMTAERFADDPFNPGFKMFKSGDRGRLLPSGNFEMLGRKDDQVKLKGYRVELGEVISAMMRDTSVTVATAIVKDGVNLIGFVTPANVRTDKFRELISESLPVYMVPRTIVAIESMPMTSNGKVGIYLYLIFRILYFVFYVLHFTYYITPPSDYPAPMIQRLKFWLSTSLPFLY